MGGSALPVVIPSVISTLQAVSGMVPVYDDGEVPQGAALPYVVIANPTENRLDRMGLPGKSITLQAHVWTSMDDVVGSGQLAAIVDKVTRAMEYPALSLTGWNLSFARVEDVLDGGSDDTVGPTVRHAVVMIRVECHPSS